MLKNVLFSICVLFIFVSCSSTNQTVTQTENILNSNNQKEIILSYEEYQKLYDNEKNSIKNKSLSNLIDEQPIISPEEYKEMLATQRAENETTDINTALMDFYNEWKNVQYKFGGNSKKGIDCSAFTQRAFKEKLDITIPRSTRTQVKVGKEIKKSQLKLGDLVFFKTGKLDRHVGIYMGKGKFMHASIKGIKFTKLDKPFYKKAYWTSRRVIH